MEQLRTIYRRLDSHRALLFCFGASLAFSLFISFFGESEAPDSSDASVERVDTFVPAGFVLVPIDLENSEFLDSLVGDFGRIDLFVRSGPNRTKLTRVASKIRLIRAPRNPSVFGVLAPNDLAPEIVKHPGPFLAVVQNPKQVGTSIEISPQRKNVEERKVIYDPEIEN